MRSPWGRNAQRKILWVCGVDVDTQKTFFKGTLVCLLYHVCSQQAQGSARVRICVFMCQRSLNFSMPLSWSTCQRTSCIENQNQSMRGSTLFMLFIDLLFHFQREKKALLASGSSCAFSTVHRLPLAWLNSAIFKTLLRLPLFGVWTRGPSKDLSFILVFELKTDHPWSSSACCNWI